jgi:hypothetical protein
MLKNYDNATIPGQVICVGDTVKGEYHGKPRMGVVETVIVNTKGYHTLLGLTTSEGYKTFKIHQFWGLQVVAG